jgi:homoserine O-acetyltransferase
MRDISRRAGFITATLILGLLVYPIAANAAGELQPQEGDVELHDFAFRDGERLPLLKLHYSTLGTPQRDATGKITNAVLLLHGTLGTGKSFLIPNLADHLFRPGQPLDVQTFYVVLPDGIGAGSSTKPSDGLRARFPNYGYRDQVDAQHAMLEGMGIDHLKLILGLSQGGMQTWLWAEQFPAAVDALVPVGSMPMQISGRNLIWREIAIRAIRDDPAWHDGDYDLGHPPVLWRQTVAPLFAVMVSNPERLQEAGPDRSKTLAYYDKLVAEFPGHDANDVLYDFKSSADYDPAPELGRIRAPMLAINFADDQVNPAQFSVTQQTVSRLPSARLVVAPGGDVGYGHFAIAHAEIWANELGAFLGQLPGWKTAIK